MKEYGGVEVQLRSFLTSEPAVNISPTKHFKQTFELRIFDPSSLQFDISFSGLLKRGTSFYI